MTVPVTAAVVVLALTLIGAAGYFVYRKKKGERENGKYYSTLSFHRNTISTEQ